MPGGPVCGTVQEDALDSLLQGCWRVLQRRQPLLPVEETLSIHTAKLSTLALLCCHSSATLIAEHLHTCNNAELYCFHCSTVLPTVLAQPVWLRCLR